MNSKRSGHGTLVIALILILSLQSFITCHVGGGPPEEGAERTLPLMGKKIVIDPGHGLYYKDGGWHYQRPYCWGVVEDELTVEIAAYLCIYLEERTGAEVFVTRELDKGAGTGISGHPKWQEGAWCHLRDTMGYSGLGSLNQDLNIRPDYANSVGGDIFISIHTNAGGGSARGTMTLWGGQDAGSGGGSPGSDKALADDIHPPVVLECGTNDRGVWKDEDMSGFSLAVLRETDMPGCLVEVAFHDNYDDNQLLQQDWFKEAAGQGMFYGIFDYYSLPRPDPDLPDIVHELTEMATDGDADVEEVNPHIAELDSGQVAVVRERRKTDRWEIVLSITGDRGLTWEDDIITVTGSPGTLGAPSFAETKNGTFFLAFERDMGGLGRLCYIRSFNGGDTWTGETELPTMPGCNVSSPTVYRTAYGTLWCSFAADGPDGGVFFCYSVDNGDSWNDPTRLSDAGCCAGRVYNYQDTDGMLWTVWAQRENETGKWCIYATSSPGWTGWPAAAPLGNESHFDLREPALGELNGDLALFYTSDRTADEEMNGDIFYRTSDDGISWGWEKLLTPNTDDDHHLATLACSDGRLWCSFSSQNGTGGAPRTYITNNVTDAGNRPPSGRLMTEDGSVMNNLTPALRFNLLDPDGDEVTGEVFLREMGTPGSIISSPLDNSSCYIFREPLLDASWYEWWLQLTDGKEGGGSATEVRTFFPDVNYPPEILGMDPSSGSVLPWDTESVNLGFRVLDGDHDELLITVHVTGDPDGGPGNWTEVYRDVGVKGGDFTVALKAGASLPSPGQWLFWRVSAVDENCTTAESAVCSLGLETAPKNLPPLVPSLSNLTVEKGDTISLSAANSTDPECGELDVAWWLFNVTGTADPWNDSFSTLHLHCFLSRSETTDFTPTLYETGIYLVQLNVTDRGAYLDPPVAATGRCIIHVVDRDVDSQPRGEIFGPGISAQGVDTTFSYLIFDENVSTSNVSWCIRLGGTERYFHTGDLSYRFSLPGDYDLTLSILLANGDRIVLRRNVTVMSREEWDAAWSVSLVPSGNIKRGQTVFCTMAIPDFAEGGLTIDWTLRISGENMSLASGTGASWLFAAEMPGEYVIEARVEYEGVSFSNEHSLTVSEDIGKKGPADEEDAGGMMDLGSGFPWHIFLFILLGVMSVGAWFLVIRERRKNGNEPEESTSHPRAGNDGDAQDHAVLEENNRD